ncbi:hypothetical protein CRYUN_Cryun08bG0069400 [Craigia yunnanensis]
MDLTSTTTTTAAAAAVNDKESAVDPFLVEALQNPRHRLTILRMELDIQRFLQNSDQQQFEFQHFPTSYLRLAAHRVAQHYGLITMVHDNGLDGLGSRIMVKRVGEIKWPTICLSEIPAKHSENDKPEQIKIAIKPRPSNGSVNEANQIGIKRNPVRSVEERKEEYDRARARIFSGLSSADSDDLSPQIFIDGKNESLIRDEFENYRSSMYDPAFPQLGQIASTQASLSYVVPARPAVSPFCDLGLNPTSRDGAYMQWPSATMMYSHSYDQFVHAALQAPFCHQPLSFDYSQNG